MKLVMPLLLRPGSVRAVTVNLLEHQGKYLLARAGVRVPQGIVVSDPTDRVELPRTWRRLPGVLTREEVTSLLEAPDALEAGIRGAAPGCGCRGSGSPCRASSR